jgi:hypothetical protein
LGPEGILSGPWQDLAIDFGNPYGVWTAHDGAEWRPVHDFSPRVMVSGDVDGNQLDDLIADYGPEFGVWARMNHGPWRLIDPSSPSRMVTGDLEGTAATRSSSSTRTPEFGAGRTTSGRTSTPETRSSSPWAISMAGWVKS